jgi:hypothetical protein
MKKLTASVKSFRLINISLSGLVLLCLTLPQCAATAPELNVAQYQFKYNDEIYRIRSIAAKDQQMSSNELLSHDFLAVDIE